jgi:hypothetical protein
MCLTHIIHHTKKSLFLSRAGNWPLTEIRCNCMSETHAGEVFIVHLRSQLMERYSHDLFPFKFSALVPADRPYNGRSAICDANIMRS